MKPLKSQTYYEILNVSRYASQEDIRKAFEICKHTFQGDSLATYTLYTDEENQEIFTLIAEAYEILRNPSLRREYDTFISSQDGNGGNGAEEEKATAAAVFRGTQGNTRGAAEGSQPAGKVAPTAKKDGQSLEAADRIDKFLKTVKQFDGAALKKARHLANWTLDELCEQTKIRKAYLEYLEEEKFELLPAAVYVKGFVIIVANAFGLPSQRVAQEYMQRYHLARV